MEQSVIRILGPADAPALEDFLLERLESSMFLLGNLRRAGIVDNGRPFEGTYAAAWRGGRMVAAAAHYWNGNLIVQAPQQVEVVGRAALAASGRPFEGLIGPSEQVERLAGRLGLAATASRHDETEILYALRLARLRLPAALAEGAVTGRLATPADVELLARWQAAYAVESLGASMSEALVAEELATMARAVAEGRTWLLECDGRPVANSSFNAETDEAVQVGGVWTPPELRRRGYGRAVVAASLLAARARGVERAILFTGVGNAAAQRAYEAIGFERIGDYRLLLLKEPVSIAPGGDASTKPDGGE